MCFQGFLHYQCQHSFLHEEECDDARALELPLFIKLQCPNYRTDVKHTPRLCGIGGFYCAQEEDGKYLDNQCRSRIDIHARLAGLERHVNERIVPERRRVMDRLKALANGSSELVLQLAKRDHEAVQLYNVLQAVEDERVRLHAQRSQSDYVITYSRQLYLLHEHHSQAKGTTFDRPRLPAYIRQAPYASVSRDAAAPPIPPLVSHGQTVRRDSARSDTTVMPVPKAHALCPDAPGKREQAKKGSRARVERDRGTSLLAHQVRRSSRNKRKVDYAEDAELSPSPRTPSPHKDAASDFSPTKSEGSTWSKSTSPAREKSAQAKQLSNLATGTCSLGDMIRNWSKIESRGQLGGLFKGPFKNRPRVTSLQSHNEQSPVATPESGSRRPSAPRRTHAPPMLANPAKAGLDSLMPLWTVNRGDSDPILTPGVSHRTNMSAYGVERTPRAVTAEPAFSSLPQVPQLVKAGLTPPIKSLIFHGNPSTTKDPKKRPPPAEHPAVFSDKKMRLSFPSQDGMHVFQPPKRRALTPVASPPRVDALHPLGAFNEVVQAPTTPPTEERPLLQAQHTQNSAPQRNGHCQGQTMIARLAWADSDNTGEQDFSDIDRGMLAENEMA